jgi:hypothetical protein
MLLPNLTRFADAAATGVVNVSTDQTGTPRYIPLISRGAGRVDPVVSAARRIAGARVPIRRSRRPACRWATGGCRPMAGSGCR